MSETELEEAVRLSRGSSSSQAFRHIDHEQIRGEQARPEAGPLDPAHSLSADAGPGNMEKNYKTTVPGYQHFRRSQIHGPEQYCSVLGQRYHIMFIFSMGEIRQCSCLRRTKQKAVEMVSSRPCSPPLRVCGLSSLRLLWLFYSNFDVDQRRVYSPHYLQRAMAPVAPQAVGAMPISNYQNPTEQNCPLILSRPSHLTIVSRYLSHVKS